MTNLNNFSHPKKIKENHLISERRAKLRKLRETTNIVYRNDFTPTIRASQLSDNNSDREKLLISEENIRMAGRLMLRRIIGRSTFASLKDSTGRIQLYLNENTLGSKNYNNFKNFDIGDIIAIEGSLFRTNTGELSIRVKLVNLLSKSLRPLPDKFHGISDQEMRYRQRYIDLIMTDSVRSTFEIRSKTINNIRQFMNNSKFIEVETPILHNIPGGALAKPFVTHHNNFNMQMFLRIAPELYLKRLIVGGFERIFELGKNFRNEGTSPNHNPEFTMMEFYAAYTDYNWLMNFLENLICQIFEKITNKSELIYQKHRLDLSRPFERLTICEAILKYSPNYTRKQLESVSSILDIMKMLEIQTENSSEKIDLGLLQLELFEKVISPKLWNPTYIVNYPIKSSPLARPLDNSSNIVERFELFIAGREIANGFSELNDPEDQIERLQNQINGKNLENEKNIFYDNDYVCALEYGMPPTAGCGIGIDRLIMLLTDSPNIRDVIFFPQLRYKQTTNL